MAKYKYKLQSVLDYREGIEEKAKVEYGQEVMNHEAMLEEMRLLEEHILQMIALMKDATQGLLDVKNLMQYPSYIDAKKAERVSLLERIKAHEEVVNEKKRLMLQAMTDRKSVEKLKEKDFEAYKQMQKKEEQKFVDQLVSYKFATAGA